MTSMADGSPRALEASPSNRHLPGQMRSESQRLNNARSPRGNNMHKSSTSRWKKILKRVSRKGNRNVPDSGSLVSSCLSTSTTASLPLETAASWAGAEPSTPESAYAQTTGHNMLQPMLPRTPQHSTPQRSHTSSQAVPRSPIVGRSPEQKQTQLQLVLLIMEPTNRKFELLQLDFESDRARVCDVLAQIPRSATAAPVRRQQYQGVLRPESATLFTDHTRLMDFCQPKQVLLALPNQLDIRKCMSLSRPILTDPKVHRMLRNNGFDLPALKRPPPMDPPRAVRRLVLPPSTPPEPVTNYDTTFRLYRLFTIAIAISILLQTIHTYLSSPMEVGLRLPLNAWRSKCGILPYLPDMRVPKYVDGKWSVDVIPLQTCVESTMEVNEDGTVSVYGPDKQLDYLFIGGSCENHLSCEDGFLLTEQGTLWMGDTRVRSVRRYRASAPPLSPWPFTQMPKVRVKDFLLNK
eukprot:Nitzschia sp. Nitz4//scaffold13_size275219//243346//244823//NITZ4_000922-RA/size275219-augustus-gene-0.242-mRNA-1//1//CDS//3329536158//5082//frame0